MDARWNSFPHLTAGELADDDQVPVSDTNQEAGSKDATTTIAALRSALGGDSTVSINAQTGTAYTLVLGDAGKLVTLTNGAAITLTVPTNASVAYPVGTVIALAQLGAGLVTVEGDTGVTINGTTPGDDDLAGQWATASLTKLATDTWLLSGGLA